MSEDSQGEEQKDQQNGDIILQMQERIDLLTVELERERSDTAALRRLMAEGAGKYKESLLARASDIPPSLVAGETFEEVEVSIAKAREIVEAVKAQNKQSISFRAPAGNQGRTLPDTSGMSSIEKIKYGLQESRDK